MGRLGRIVVGSPLHVALPASDRDLAAALRLQSLLHLAALAQDRARVVVLVVARLRQEYLPRLLQVLPVGRWNKLGVHFLEIIN